MPPKDKPVISGVSSSSLLALKAEVTKMGDAVRRDKVAGRARAIVGGVKRPDKKPTIWTKSNAGVQARAARDVESEAIDRSKYEIGRAALLRKTAMYQQLAKGKDGGISEEQRLQMNVDWDQKADFNSKSDDEDEDDPVIEYEDEYGRTRSAHRSEIPSELQQAEQEQEDIDPYVEHGPINHFPVYEPSMERKEAIREQFAEENNPLNVHYDDTGEVRAKGAGFYRFSGDEETRQQQMEELRNARMHTEQARRELGAEDVRPGKVEGMHAEGVSGGTPERSLAMMKRKLAQEQRKKEVQAKRRKVEGQGGATVKEPPTHVHMKTTISAPSPAVADSLAAAELPAGHEHGKEERAAKPAPIDVDAFLANCVPAGQAK